MHKKLSLIALQGPKSSEILEKTIKGVSSLKFMNGNKFSYNGKGIYITRSGYTGEDGFEISITNELVENFAKKYPTLDDVSSLTTSDRLAELKSSIASCPLPTTQW